ncbi:MAG: hypothetical protein ACKVIM_07750 [Flavobacteriales bacterium]|jgi:hypothetical protein|tara:strand:+ start:257 stop:412 length:156 start_codon:yes stop_codon:yes gene_type:complete
MSNIKDKKNIFDPNKVPFLGSLGLLALGDVGFTAWRKVKSDHKQKKLNEKK